MTLNRPLWRMKRIWLIGVILFILVAITLIYVKRNMVAEKIGERWCQSRELVCTLKVETLSLQRVVLGQLSVGKDEAPDILTASDIQLDLTWPSGLTPKVTFAKIVEPSIRGQFDGQTLSFYGLETVFSGGGTEHSSEIPRLEIERGQIALNTPAGDLSGQFDASGAWPQLAQASAVLEPANLKSGTQVLTLQAAELELNAVDGVISGKIYVDLPRLSFDRATMEAIKAEATFIPDDKPRIDWTGEIGAISIIDQFDAVQAIAQGVVILREMPGQTSFNILDAMDTFTAKGATDTIAVQGVKTDRTVFDVQGQKDGDNRLSVTADARAEQLSTSFANIANTHIKGEGSFNAENGSFRGSGEIVATRAVISKPNRVSLLTPLRDLEATSSHATSLRQSLDMALSDFTTGGNFQIEYDGPRQWQLVIPQKIAMRSASGLNVLLNPSTKQSAIFADQDGAEIKGILTLDGGGAPTVRADIRSLKVSDSSIALDTGGLTLSPWQPGPTSIAAKLNRFSLRQQAGQLRASALGELTLSGNVLGVEVGETRVFGGIDAANGREGWRVQTVETPCIGVELGGLKMGGGIRLTQTDFTICPEDQRFIRQDGQRATGRITLGNINLPFQGTDVSGNAQLTDTRLEWSYDEQLKLDLGATRIFVPMQIGDRSLNIATTRPLVDIALGKSTQINARVSDTSLSGQLVPASVTIGSGNFEGRLIAQGFTGQASATNVRISDINADPIYRPLLSTLNATFDGSRMSISGPVRLSASGLKVAQVGLNMDLISLDGTGFVTSETLEFQPNGLQPKDLSDRVRGLLSNGRGSLVGRADLNIESGSVSGTGQITARDFGFDTFRIGAVDGVSGTLNFSDLIALSTPPGQTVSIAKLDPGIPLNNGELSFQILGGRQANIESAIWPFAGGTLRALPTEWTIAGTSDIVTIEANKIELSELIETLSLPDIEAEGTVSGTFPIELQGGNAFVRNARLVADTKGGVIRYTGNALPKPQGPDEENVVQAAFKALRDLRYSVLELGVDGNLIGDIVVSLKLLGQNKDVLGGADFSFNIAVDSKLAQLIQSGRGLMSSDVITETIVNEVKRLEEANP